MNCDLCGSAQPLSRAFIEGSELNVCSKCAKFGKIVPKANIRPNPRPTSHKYEQENIHVLVSDFAQLIKSSREKLNLKQEDVAKTLNEKESLLQKVENGLVPNPVLTRKLEKFFKIKLVSDFKSDEKKPQMQKSADLTLGDFVKIKKK